MQGRSSCFRAKLAKKCSTGKIERGRQGIQPVTLPNTLFEPRAHGAGKGFAPLMAKPSVKVGRLAASTVVDKTEPADRPGQAGSDAIPNQLQREVAVGR